MINPLDFENVVADIQNDISRASSLFNEWMFGQNHYAADPSWLIEGCFLKVMAAAEVLSLPELRGMVFGEYLKIKEGEHGFSNSELDPDGEPYSTPLTRLRLYFRTLQAFVPTSEQNTVRKGVDQILRDIHYVITDTKVFARVPSNEMDVHVRIEAVLKCVFPDLKTKPTLTKQIKNFEPDTGITSIETLIEYKFLSRAEDAPRIADEILADTRGYTSKDWSSFLYVIYETKRFRTEHDWNQFLRESGVPPNTRVIVLSGEPEPVLPLNSTTRSKLKPAR
jgi:hypothetical protein